ncbi:hypothetical protein [Bradyrhizobium iriomotense]|uniref:Transposase n=1 Tax=Bradyrhizobium iriomotense TaxID=441950 RepID=A0ABQ6AUH1_9BRAD|nr:hypothetical protein [Bradyrhizobium iriomotense]GLR85842.1 hypothetical protein GCM10007857_25530 [Bradyrhizobium iriomotense]
MLDPLLARAQLAILENRTLRREANSLRDQIDDARAKLRLSLLESQMQCAEFNAIREDRHWRRVG